MRTKTIAIWLLSAMLIFALAVMADTCPLKLVIQGRTLSITNPTARDVAAIKIGSSHVLVRLYESVLPAGKSIEEPQRLPDDFEITGVAFEDGTAWGDLEVSALKSMRDQMAAGGPIQATPDMHGGWYHLLAARFRLNHPGQAVPRLIPPKAPSGSENGPPSGVRPETWGQCPGGICFSFSSLSWKASSYYGNGNPGTITLDECGLWQVVASQYPPGSVQSQASAKCVLPTYYNRPQIGSGASAADYCPPGTPGGSHFFGAQSYADYGWNGLGGPCSEAWGPASIDYVNLTSGQVIGEMDDSCNYPQPRIGSEGGFGGCQQ